MFNYKIIKHSNPTPGKGIALKIRIKKEQSLTKV